jgi:myo-inositol-1(or 4)-monophosphatase
VVNPKHSELKKRLEFLEQALSDARSIVLEGYSQVPGTDQDRQSRLQSVEKSSHKDLVTVYDKRVEEFLTQRIEQVFPGESILGEEQSSASGNGVVEPTADAFWLIDPIDGTTNYTRAYPFFCSVMAYVERPPTGAWSVELGGVYDPLRNEMFSAMRGGGAYLNRQRLAVSQVQDPKKALLTTGFAQLRRVQTARNFELFKKITMETLGVRRDGSAALDLAYVASGRIDAYWEWGLAPWDVAAGALLVQEAGGTVSGLSRSEFNLFSAEILAANPNLHDWIYCAINEKDS